LQLTGAIVASVYNGPADETISPITQCGRGNGIPPGTIVIPEKPIAPFQANILNIVEEYRFKITGVVGKGNIVQSP